MTLTIPTAVRAELRSLTSDLDRPGVDLENVVHGVADAARAVVPSYRGLSITVFLGAGRFVLPAMEEFCGTAGIASSARVSMPLHREADPRSTIVFYATDPGAFLHLATDLGHAIGRTVGGVVLDADLIPPWPPGADQLHDLGCVHQGIGILIARGHSPPDARVELHGLAQRTQVSLADAARQLIRSGPARTCG